MVSVAIIAKNAAHQLPACIDSLGDLTDDVVVVVDASSVDETKEISQKLGARVFVHQFDNFADQKNYALKQCKYEWVLSMDADEQLSPLLRAEIKEELKSPKADGYLIPRANYFFGKKMKHSNWEPESDVHCWLFRKSVGHWVGQVHEEVQVKGKIAKLKNYKIHQAYTSVDQFMVKMNQYTTFEALTAHFSLFKLVTEPGKEFLRRYVWHAGFLDGWLGLFTCYLSGIYQVQVQIKAWLKTK